VIERSHAGVATAGTTPRAQRLKRVQSSVTDAWRAAFASAKSRTW
jgi:hypothetical protein